MLVELFQCKVNYFLVLRSICLCVEYLPILVEENEELFQEDRTLLFYFFKHFSHLLAVMPSVEQIDSETYSL